MSAAGGQGFVRQSGGWHRYETVMQVDLVNPKSGAQVWVLVPSVNKPDWFKSLGSDCQTNAAAEIYLDGWLGCRGSRRRRQ